MRTKAKSKLKILCVLDDFSSHMLAYEPNVSLEHASPHFMPLFYKHYDMLLVESAWLGRQRKWKYRVASYPDHPERNHDKLARLVLWAKNKGIPTVFWNKEDPFHFEQFIDSAKLFDYIFSTDASILEQYQHACPNAKVAALSFPFQPKLHFPAPFEQIIDRSSVFVGSYMRHMHSKRQQWQDLCFTAAAPYGLTIVDRHAYLAKTQPNYQFPEIENILYQPAVEYTQTAAVYHRHQQAINVNTITDSPSMYSRRLIEIMACNRLAISNPSLAIDQCFPDMCETIEHADEAKALFEQLQYGYSAAQIEKVHTARQHVFEHYTVSTWLKNILRMCDIDHPYVAHSPAKQE